MTIHTKNYTDRTLAVWDLANVTSAGTRYNLDPFRSNASGLSDHYLEGATFTFAANAEARLVTVSDNDADLNDGDHSQDTAGGGFIPEYAYRIRPEGGTAADDIIIYATEVGGHTVNGLVATAPIEAGVTYNYIENISNHPTVSYDALVATVVPVPDGTVEGSDAADEMGLGYTDEKTDMITAEADVIEANGGNDVVCADDGDDVIYGGSANVGGEVAVTLPDATSYMQWFYTDLVIDQFDLEGLTIAGVNFADIEIGGVRIGDLDLAGATIGDLMLGNGPLSGLLTGEFDNISLNGVPIKEAFFQLKMALGECDNDADKDALLGQFEGQIMPALTGIKLNLAQDAQPAVVDIYDRDRDGSFDYGQRTQNIDNNELFQNATRAAPGASFIVRPEGGTEADDVTIYLSAFDTTVVGFVSDKPLILTQNYCFVGLGDMQPSVNYADIANTYFEGPLTTVEDGTGMDSGDDLLKGEGGNDTIYGQDGNDTIEGGEGADLVYGGDDCDTIIVSSQEDGAGDVVHGGAGGKDYDILDLTGAGEVTITATTDSDGNGQDGTVTFANGETLTFTNIEEIIQDAPVVTPDGCVDGEETADNMRVGYDDAEGATNGGGDLVTNQSDVIKGNGGNDVIRAGRGNDEVYGGEDRDKLYGQGGNDTLYGNEDRDVLVGGGGNDVLDGGQDNDRMIGGAGADTMSGGDDRDTFVIRSAKHADGDVVDGGDGATVTRDFDTLDLRKAGLVRFVNQVEDTDGNGFDGSIEFVTAEGVVTATMDYTNIERFRIDGEFVEQPVCELGAVTYEVVDDFQNPTALGDEGRNDAYSLKVLTAACDKIEGYETTKAYCLAVRAPLDTDAAFDGANVLNGEMLLATTENATMVRDQSANEPLNILSGVGVNEQDAVENMDLITFILNQDWDQMDNGDGKGETYTDTEVQYAIWALTNGDDAQSTTDANTWANAVEIAMLADENGEGYTGGQYVGVIVEPTDNGDRTDVNTQPFIIALDADCIA